MSDLDDAREILETLQAGIDARDADALVALFDDPAMLIGTSGDGRHRDGLIQYLNDVATGEPFRWDYDEIVPFHRDEHMLAFAAFGDIVAGDFRAPFRLTVLAARVDDGWRIKQFHGSIPYGT